jgi:amino acid adenylation domain-containing protein/non-ribosomal peptide synthase protein (TIGR01720 family)
MDQVVKKKKAHEQEKYWLETFTSEIPVPEIPTDYAPPLVQDYQVDHVKFIADGTLTNELNKIARDTHSSLYMVLLSAYYILLFKYTGNEDIVVGSPITANFNNSNSRGLNTLELRNYPEGNKEFRVFLNEVKQTTLKAYENQDYPLETLKDNLKIGRETNRNLFDTMFVLQDIDDAELQTERSIDHKVAKFNLLISASQKEGMIEFNLEYNTSLFKQESTKRMAEHYIRILEEIVESVDRKIFEFEMITPIEKQEILTVFNATGADYPKDKTICSLFEEQAEKVPDKTAIVFEEQQLTYRELNERANQVARVLRRRGVTTDSIVGIKVERSIEMVVGILAVLKAGGAYLPIDPSYPQERIDYLLEDSGASLLLTQYGLQKGAFKGEVIDLTHAALYEEDATNLDLRARPDDLAYVIYTSGSTGRPKGVMVEHNGGVNLLNWFKENVPLADATSFLSLASFSFDAFGFEMWGSLTLGLTLVLGNAKEQLDPDAMVNLMKKHKIDAMNMTPSRLNILLSAQHSWEVLNLLKFVSISGAAMASNQWEKLRERSKAAIYNRYGPAETTVTVTCGRLDTNQINIGKPLSNIRAYIVNPHSDQLQPIGIIGEICISGVCLARGYINQPHLTTQKFVESPFSPGERMYRTGDLGRWLPDGNIEFIGRIDDQVKVRGYRIELGEIETQLANHESIQEVVVLAKEDEQYEKYLCAYIVGNDNLDASKLRTFLSKTLPEYMIPSFFINIDKIPLTTNGKIDKKKLSKLDGIMQVQTGYLPPRDDTEKKLVQIWREELKVEQIGVNDNFFELGGNSLKVVSLIFKIQKSFKVQVPLQQFFQLPTINQLSRYIMALDDRSVNETEIKPANVQRFYPVSSSQKRLIFLDQMTMEGVHYNVPFMVIINGPLERDRLDRVFKVLFKRHEILRTSFELINGSPVQKINNNIDLNIELFKCNEEEIRDTARSFVRSFNLNQAPLIRVGLIEVSSFKHVLMIDFHHAIIDRQSISLLMNEFNAVYQGKSLPAIKIHYKDYALWQENLIIEKKLEEQEKYWLRTFSEEIPVLEIPTDFTRPLVQTYIGNRIPFFAGETLTRCLKRLALENNSTLYMVLLAAYYVLLHKYTNQRDIVIGSPIAGRRHPDLENTIGMFVNTLALRNFPEGDKKFRLFLSEVRDATINAYENQDYPFDVLVDKLVTNRDASRNPLFDTMFVLQNTDDISMKIDGLDISSFNFEQKIAKFDLLMSATEKQGKIELSLEYNTSLFKHESTKKMTDHYLRILEEIVESVDRKIFEIDMMTTSEKQKILTQFNTTEADYPKDQTICSLFEEQVEKVPDKTAVVFEEKQLTYRELNERANQVARVLRRRGVTTDRIVGIMVERSIEMVVGILAVLKAGGAYLPIDPSYPQERIDYLLEDSAANILLTQPNWLEKVAFKGEVIDLTHAALYEEDATNLDYHPRPHDLAYVIYTSGSTGRPKGVMVEHVSLLNRIYWMQRQYPIGLDDVILQKTTFTFDVSVWELVWWMVSGASVNLLRVGGERDPKVLIETIDKERVSVVHFVPSMFNALLDYLEFHPQQFDKLCNLKYVMASGEALTIKQVDRFKNKLKEPIQLVNLYGPTEATIDVTYFDCLLSPKYKTVPIGKPIDNIKLYVLGSNDQIKPIGVIGELCVSGVGLARGYLNLPELTAQKFVANPFIPGERMYRTGDLARWLPDGNIEYIGRIDDQVKIRGYRIELGEIEAQLRNHRLIQEVVVLALEDDQAGKYLCAYLVSREEIDVSEFRQFLSESLPEYMIPSYFVRIEQLPLTPNGKLDKKGLPAPVKTLQQHVTKSVAPRDEIESMLAQIWQDVLGLEKVGIHDNFFELGGDSIKTIQISARLHKYGLSLGIRDLFKYPCIADVRGYVKKIEKEVEQKSVEGRIELSPIQKWFFERSPTDLHHWNQSMMLFREEGFDEEIVRKAFQEILKHHDILRATYQIKEEKIVQVNRAYKNNGLFSFEVVDVEENIEKIERETARIQASMNLAEGPLVKLALFRTSEGDHLLITIHHLVIDGVSWRILFEDLNTGYTQALQDQEIRFPAKTDSYQRWTRTLKEYASDKKAVIESEYWRGIEETTVVPLPKDNVIREDLVKDSRSKTMTLSVKETDTLLKKVNRAYHTEITDILLVALGTSIHEWTGEEKVVVSLEGHGREDILDGVDVTRTIGWFTSIFPVLLEVKTHSHIPDRIKNIKENLRRIPNKGVGYGILKYLSPAGTNYSLKPEISFNYLGQFDQDIQTSVFKRSKYNTKQNRSPKSERQYILNINGMVMDGQLHLDFEYNARQFDRSSIDRLVKRYQENLYAIMNHCMNQDVPEITPSDVGESDISLEEFEGILDHIKTL